jgi:hypothetical protein
MLTSSPAKNIAVITPNSGTPYWTLWLDLRAGPMLIPVPAMPTGKCMCRCSLCPPNSGYLPDVRDILQYLHR